MDPTDKGTSEERITPIRHRGESEVRLSVGGVPYEGSWTELEDRLRNNPISTGIQNGTLKEEQLQQVIRPRGYMTDIDSAIFSSVVDMNGEAVSAKPSLLYAQKPLSDTEYFNRKLQGLDSNTLIQALVDHYGPVVSDEVQELVDKISQFPKLDPRDPASIRHVSELLQDPLFAFIFGSDYDSAAVMEAKVQAEQLKIRQNYLETIAGMRLPRFLVPDTTEFPYDPEAQYIGLMLPYRRCLFILNPGVNARLVYCEQLDEDKIKLTVKISTHGEDNTDTIGEFQFEWKEGKLVEEGWFSDEFTKETAQELRCILAILDGMSKNYVVAEGDPPPKDRVIPEARKGCTVRVVKLHPQSETIRKAWQGGTHASPREHTRIAHWRRNCHGVRVRIQEKIVNKGKTDGVVDKEYYIRKKDAIARKIGIKTKRKK